MLESRLWGGQSIMYSIACLYDHGHDHMHAALTC